MRRGSCSRACIRASTAGAVAALFLLAAGGAGAQGEVFCYLTDIKAEALSNAVRVIFTADGTISPQFNLSDFWTSSYKPMRLRSIRFRLPNARSRVGSFKDVAEYPVSHVGLSVPRESRAGVGLDVELVLYRPGTVVQYNLGGGESWYMGGSGLPGPYIQISKSTDQRSLIIVVLSDRYRELDTAEQGTQLAQRRTALEVTPGAEGRLTVHALNADLGQIVEAVAAAGGVRAAVSDEVQRHGSLALADTDAQSVFRALARAYGLSLDRREGLYVFSEGTPESVGAYGGSASAIFPVQHMPAEDALELLPDFLLRYVRVDRSHNALAMTGPPQLLAKLGATLQRVDLPQPQIELRPLLVESVTEGGLERALEVLLARGTTEAQLATGPGDLGVHVVNTPLRDLRVRLRALERRRWVRLQIAPVVVVRNNQQGNIFVGQTQYYPLLVGFYQGVQLRSVEVGTQVWCQPWTGGTAITVPLFMEANNIISVDAQGVPLVATRRLFTQVRVTSEETMVLGGLTMFTNGGEHRHPPGLEQVAPLDLALGAEERARQQTEVLVLLQARLAAEPAPPRPAADGAEAEIADAPSGERL